MRRGWRIGLILAAGLCLIALVWMNLPDPGTSPTKQGLSLNETLGGEEDGGFARALAPRKFIFPEDHGPHPEFKTEWWYYTGNLQTLAGRHFGYQLTFFRIALTPDPPPRRSAWASNQVYMAHFALTDTEAERFYHFERFSRAAQNLAGASAAPFRVWLEDWSATSVAESDLPMQLQATEDELAIKLNLHSDKPPVLQGEQGLSQKSAEPGNASYYYSLTRLSTAGEVSIGEQIFQVSGTSWLDREWSTSALGKDQVGWDWFSLQFDDGRELMFYQLRRKDGSADPLSSGVLVEADGSSQRLALKDVEIEVLKTWRSPHSDAKYPSLWRLQVPEQQLVIELRPLLSDQELQTSVRYWEGAVELHGTSRADKLTGRGYVELTGYQD